MSIKLTPVKCPQCGAMLPVEEGRFQMYCSYCGTKIIITNENEYFYHNIDEAAVQKAEAERLIRLKELELEENKTKGSEKIQNILLVIWISISLIIIILGIGIMFFGGGSGPLYGFCFLFYVGAPIIGGGGYLIFKVLPEKENNKKLIRMGGVRLPNSIFPYSDTSYEVVQMALRNAGFNNVTCISLHDVMIGILQKPGIVESISVDGKMVTSGGKVFMPDVPIIITYHGR